MTNNTEDGRLYLDRLQWKTWVPFDALSPEFADEAHEGDRTLVIKGTGKDTAYGKWITTVEGIKEGLNYKFSVDYLASDIKSETLSVQAIMTWRKSNGSPVQRDYADCCTKSGREGWKSLSRSVLAPAGAQLLDIELVLRYPESGSVLWQQPLLSVIPAPVLRKVKIASPLVYIRKQPENSLSKNMDYILGVIDETAELKPDLICLGEKNFEDCIENVPLDLLADTIPGARTDAVADKARKYNCYIIFSMAERNGRNFYNTAVLIDRKGNIAGTYRKTHLPLSEAESGYTPGNEYPVFDTDFGKIGIMICWDQMFPEIARIMAMKGAEIIFIPTQGDALVQQEARAIDNSVYIVTGGIYRPTSSRIINPVGEVLSVADEGNNHIAFAELDLNKSYYKHWMSVGPCDGEPHSLYIKERRPDTYGDVAKDI